MIAFHTEQSFKENVVMPEIAHEIGVKLAEEMWGNRFQVVVSTHLNTEHLHNYFVIKSVLFKDGYKYYYRAVKLSVRREPYKRNIRVERTFGEEYSVDNIKKKILENDYV